MTCPKTGSLRRSVRGQDMVGAAGVVTHALGRVRAEEYAARIVQHGQPFLGILCVDYQVLGCIQIGELCRLLLDKAAARVNYLPIAGIGKSCSGMIA